MDALLLSTSTALIALGLVLLLNAWRDWTWRRGLFAGTFVVAGLAIGWMRFGDGWESRRQVVLVVSADITDAAIRPLLAELGKVEPDTQVAFVVLDPDAPNDSREPAKVDHTAWQNCAERLHRPELLPKQALSKGPRVNPGADVWVDQMALACTGLFHLPGRWFAKPTVVFVHDEGNVWSRANLQAMSVDAMDRLIKRLVTYSDAEAYLYAAGRQAERGGTLSLQVNEHTIPAVDSVRDLSGYKVEMLLTGCPENLKPDDLTVEATLLSPKPDTTGADAAPAGFKTFTYQDYGMKLKPGPAGEFSGRLLLNAFSPQNTSDDYTVGTGFHLLRVAVTAFKGQPSEFTYHAERYLDVAKAGLLVLNGAGTEREGLGPMASRSWDEWTEFADAMMPDPHPPKIAAANDARDLTAKDLIDYYYAEWAPLMRFPRPPIDYDHLPSTRYDNARGPIDPAQAAQQGKDDRSADTESLRGLKKKLDGARTVVLLEPSLPELAYLDSLMQLDERIQHGLNVLVAGPPPSYADGSVPPPRWLHTVATRAEAAEGLPEARRIHRDRRLYFLFDDARFMSFPYDPQKREVTPLGVQAQVANGLLKQLGVARGEVFKATGSVIRSDRQIQYAALDAKPPEAPAPILAVMPALALRSSSRAELLTTDFDRNGGGGTDLGYLFDLAPDHLGLRVAGLLQNPPAKPLQPLLRPLLKSDLYPGTDVVLFVSDLPQLPEDQAAKTIAGLELGLSADSKDTFAFHAPSNAWPNVQTLEEMGIRVHVVRLIFGDRLPGHMKFVQPIGKNLDDCLKANNPSPAEPRDTVPGSEWKPDKQELKIVVDGDMQSGEVVRKLADRLKSREPPPAIPVDRGRVIDERVTTTARAPETQEILTELESPPDRWRPAAATVPGQGILRDFPLMTQREYGQGRVVVVAYSPFAADVWNADAGAGSPLIGRWKGMGAKPEYYQGWGIQRLADLVTLAGAVRPLPATRLEPRSIDLLPDRSGIDIHCWGDFGQARWTLPRMQGGSLDAELSPLTLDSQRQIATFRFHFEPPEGGPAALAGTYFLKLGASSQDRRAICLDLVKGGLGGADLLTTLQNVAEFTGGGRIDHPGEGLTAHYRRSSAWLGVLILSVIALFMFSPLARPWTAFFAMLRRLWRGPADLRPSRGTELDAQSFVVERGISQGRPKSGRIAGLPAGEKQYESGDRLASARPASLLPFSATFDEVPLPPRVPWVRLRYVTRSFECLILIDNTPGMSIPEQSPQPTKAAYCVFLARVIAGIAWQQGGIVRCARTDGLAEPWGPSTGSGEMEALGVYVQTALDEAKPRRAGQALSVPGEAAASGWLVFLLSDLLAHTADEIAAFTQVLTSAGATLRVARVHDPEESTLIGVGRQRGALSLYDRAETTPQALEAAYETHGRQMAQAIETHGGRAITVDTSRALSDLADLFEQTQWLLP